MWFKNLIIYRLPAGLKLDIDSLESKLAGQALQPCGAMEHERRGWVSPSGNGRPVHVVNQQVLIALGVESKLLPAAVVNQAAQKKAEEIEEQQGYKVGRKQMREIKEQVADELLPRAFVRRRSTRAWIDPVNGWLVVDASSRAKAEVLLEALSKAVDDLPVKVVRTKNPPVRAMTEWLMSSEAPAGFTIDQDLSLTTRDETGATVRYTHHDLEGEDIREHIASGKLATRLGMTWGDRISFVLGENLEIKRLAFLDILKEQAEQGESADEQFDIDFALMAGEVAKMLDDLMISLGETENQGEMS